MVPANQITGFLNQVFLQNKLMKQCNSLDVGTKLQKLKVDVKFFGWAWSKRVWPIWSLDFKIDYIFIINR